MFFRTATISSEGGRCYNEDSTDFVLLQDVGCWVVADGLGGHRGGKEASSIAVEAVLSEFKTHPEISPQSLARCLQRAQRAVMEAQAPHSELSEMRSTIAVLMADRNHYLMGHVGDTRLYLFRDGCFVLRSMDHSVPQALVASGAIVESEIRGHEDRNRLLKSLGKAGEFKPTITKLESVYQGDVFLLCTDGFWEYLLEPEMEISLAKAVEPLSFLQELEHRLRRKVSEGNDNYTALAMFHGSERPLPRGGNFGTVSPTRGPLFPQMVNYPFILACLTALVVALTALLSVRVYRRVSPPGVTVANPSEQGQSPVSAKDAVNIQAAPQATPRVTKGAPETTPSHTKKEPSPLKSTDPVIPHSTPNVEKAGTQPKPLVEPEQPYQKKTERYEEEKLGPGPNIEKPPPEIQIEKNRESPPTTEDPKVPEVAEKQDDSKPPKEPNPKDESPVSTPAPQQKDASIDESDPEAAPPSKLVNRGKDSIYQSTLSDAKEYGQ